MARYDQLEGYAEAAGFELPVDLITEVAFLGGYFLDRERIADFKIRDAADAITAAMRVAFKAILAEVRELPADTPLTELAALRAGGEAAAAWHKLDVLVKRYQALMAAADLLWHCPERNDVDRQGLFVDTTAVMAGGGNLITPDAYVPAGPRGQFERLLWLANNSQAQAVLLTPAERRNAFETFRVNFARGRFASLHDYAVSGQNPW
jgi:hypothetical protein